MITKQELLQCFLSEDVLSNRVSLSVKFHFVLIDKIIKKKRIIALFHWQCEPVLNIFIYDTLPSLFDPTSQQSGAAKYSASLPGLFHHSGSVNGFTLPITPILKCLILKPLSMVAQSRIEASHLPATTPKQTFQVSVL